MKVDAMAKMKPQRNESITFVYARYKLTVKSPLEII